MMNDRVQAGCRRAVAVLKDKAEKWDAHWQREQDLLTAIATAPAYIEMPPPLVSPPLVRHSVISLRQTMFHVFLCWLQPTSLHDSAILPTISSVTQKVFLSELRKNWLPNKWFELLYRGSRNGMTPAAFHNTCDRKGPTLVLIAAQSARLPVSVFGGYASLSWSSDRRRVSSAEAFETFLFSVTNPAVSGVIKMPVIHQSDDEQAMFCFAGAGPVFGDDAIALRNGALDPYTPFDNKSCCLIASSGNAFGDPLGLAFRTFTGGKVFKPIEVEVWAVVG